MEECPYSNNKGLKDKEFLHRKALASIDYLKSINYIS